MKLVALADIHIRESSKGLFNELFTEMGQMAEAMLLCGDLTDRGFPSEASILVQEVREVRIPIIAVLGNHDFHNNEQEEIKRILKEAGIIVLDAEPYEYLGIGFAGVKGFMGGFDSFELGSFGEKLIKSIVAETDSEAHDLENQLRSLQTKKKIVLMHYSPISDTVRGESPELYPFLGATRFAQVIDQFGGTHVFHGHAHYGSPEGKTGKGIPVYNVAFQVMKKKASKQPYLVIEV